MTGWLKDFSGSYVLPMFVVGGLMLLSGALMIGLSRRDNASPEADAAPTHEDLAPVGIATSESVR